MMLQYTNYRQKYFLKSLKLKFSDLKRITNVLSELAKSARESEIKYQRSIHIVPVDATPDEDLRIKYLLNSAIENIEKYAHLTLTIEDDSGEQRTIVFDKNIDKDFDNIRFPSRILKLTYDNTWHYDAVLQKFYFNQIRVVLDFSDIGVFNFHRHDKELSCFAEVTGLEETIVLGAIEKIKKAFEPNFSEWNSFLHKYMRYDPLLWIVGIPLILFLQHKTKIGELLFSTLSAGLQPIAYLAVTLLALICFRIFYNYTKWLFPYLEIAEQPKTLQLVQRGLAGLIGAAVLQQWGSGLWVFFDKYILHNG